MEFKNIQSSFDGSVEHLTPSCITLEADGGSQSNLMALVSTEQPRALV